MNRDPGQLGRAKVLAVAEHSGGEMAPVTRELVACGRKLAEMLGLEFALLVLGGQAEELGRQAAQENGAPVIACRVPGLDEFHGEAQRLLLKRLAGQLGAEVMLGAHTTSGMEWAPGLALGLGASFVSGVESWEAGPEGLVLSRAAHHGKLQEKIAPTGRRLVLTLQPGAIAPADHGRPSPGNVEVLTLEQPTCRTRVRMLTGRPEGDAGLSRARVVVAGGRGVGKPENFSLLRGLAALFGDAAVAGSRPVCDQGWLSHQSQVGLTGATVSPRLYLALGISGARQHVVGMQGSEFIVAVNTDPAAPIFNYCDIGVVEDLSVFIPALLEAAGRQAGGEGPGRG